MSNAKNSGELLSGTNITLHRYCRVALITCTIREIKLYFSSISKHLLHRDKEKSSYCLVVKLLCQETIFNLTVRQSNAIFRLTCNVYNDSFSLNRFAALPHKICYHGNYTSVLLYVRNNMGYHLSFGRHFFINIFSLRQIGRASCRERV